MNDLRALQAISSKLEEILAELDAHEAHIAAAHVQAGLDALRAQVDLPPAEHPDRFSVKGCE
jgi:hypothetical protein